LTTTTEAHTSLDDAIIPAQKPIQTVRELFKRASDPGQYWLELTARGDIYQREAADPRLRLRDPKSSMAAFTIEYIREQAAQAVPELRQATGNEYFIIPGRMALSSLVEYYRKLSSYPIQEKKLRKEKLQHVYNLGGNAIEVYVANRIWDGLEENPQDKDPLLQSYAVENIMTDVIAAYGTALNNMPKRSRKRT
jgi:hypothetical protein